MSVVVLTFECYDLYWVWTSVKILTTIGMTDGQSFGLPRSSSHILWVGLCLVSVSVFFF